MHGNCHRRFPGWSGLNKYDGVIALGCIIRGGTPHFEYVAGEATRGLGAVARSSSVPVSLGVLTTDTVDQALERAGTKAGNKGWDAALSVLEMSGLFQEDGVALACRLPGKGRNPSP